MERHRWLLTEMDENSLREKLIESDFDWKNLVEKGDGFFFNHCLGFIVVMFLIKHSLFVLGNY